MLKLPWTYLYNILFSLSSAVSGNFSKAKQRKSGSRVELSLVASRVSAHPVTVTVTFQSWPSDFSSFKLSQDSLEHCPRVHTFQPVPQAPGTFRPRSFPEEPYVFACTSHVPCTLQYMYVCSMCVSYVFHIHVCYSMFHVLCSTYFACVCTSLMHVLGMFRVSSYILLSRLEQFPLHPLPLQGREGFFRFHLSVSTFNSMK